jgi:ATP-binding cassette subfamily B protein
VEAVLEYLQGMSVVRAFGLGKDSGQTVRKAIDGSCAKNLKLEYSAVPWMALQQLVVRAASVAMIVVSLLLYLGGGMGLASCLLMLIASFLVFGNLESAGNMSALLQMLGASMDKANSIDDTPTMDIEGKDLSPADASVSFEKVDFSYEDRKILDDVTFRVPEKTTTTVVGPLGRAGRQCQDRRPGRAGLQAGQPDEKYQHGVPERLPFQRHHREQHQVRQARCHP